MTSRRLKTTIQMDGLMEPTPREIRNYKTIHGYEPFKEWLVELKDVSAKVAIVKRLERVQFGNLGDCEPVGEGVLELRFHMGSGYRVYLGQDGKMLIVLLCGGQKASQKADIRIAKDCWQDYWKRKLEEERRHGKA